MNKEIKKGVYVKNEEMYELEFRTNLSVVEKLAFVNSVMDLLVTEDNYNSVIRNLIFDFYTIALFTNVNIKEFKDKDNALNLEIIEEFLEETNVIDVVKANAEIGLFEELNRAIDLNIQYKTGIRVNMLEEALVGLVNTLQNKFGSFDVNSALEMLEAFQGVSEDFTVENIVNAYMNSDLHKQNVAELEEYKNKDK